MGDFFAAIQVSLPAKRIPNRAVVPAPVSSLFGHAQASDAPIKGVPRPFLIDIYSFLSLLSTVYGRLVVSGCGWLSPAFPPAFPASTS
jgi:hypothetical protein